jgi:predicted HicB family RNase H-like nuclease
MDMTKIERKRCKTFPLEMEDDLHKALKYKAIEADKTLHAFIIDVLVAKVQEEPAQYAVSRHHAQTPKRKE